MDISYALHLEVDLGENKTLEWVKVTGDLATWLMDEGIDKDRHLIVKGYLDKSVEEDRLGKQRETYFTVAEEIAINHAREKGYGNE